MLPAGNSVRGKVDIPYFLGLGFLVFSLIAIVSVAVSPSIRQIFAPKAEGTSYGPPVPPPAPPPVPPPVIPPAIPVAVPPAAPQAAVPPAVTVPVVDNRGTPTGGYVSLDQILNPLAAPNRTGYASCASTGCPKGTQVSGFYMVDGHYYPVGESANGPTATNLSYISINQTALALTGGKLPAGGVKAMCGQAGGNYHCDSLSGLQEFVTVVPHQASQDLIKIYNPATSPTDATKILQDLKNLAGIKIVTQANYDKATAYITAAKAAAEAAAAKAQAQNVITIDSSKLPAATKPISPAANNPYPLATQIWDFLTGGRASKTISSIINYNNIYYPNGGAPPPSLVNSQGGFTPYAGEIAKLIGASAPAPILVGSTAAVGGAELFTAGGLAAAFPTQAGAVVSALSSPVAQALGTTLSTATAGYLIYGASQPTNSPAYQNAQTLLFTGYLLNPEGFTQMFNSGLKAINDTVRVAAGASLPTSIGHSFINGEVVNGADPLGSVGLLNSASPTLEAPASAQVIEGELISSTTPTASNALATATIPQSTAIVPYAQQTTEITPYLAGTGSIIPYTSPVTALAPFYATSLLSPAENVIPTPLLQQTGTNITGLPVSETISQSTAIVPYSQPSTAILPYTQPSTQLISYTAGNTSIVPYSPPVTTLAGPVQTASNPIVLFVNNTQTALAKFGNGAASTLAELPTALKLLTAPAEVKLLPAPAELPRLPAPVDLTKVTVAPDGDPFVSAEAVYQAESTPALTRRVADIQNQVAKLDAQAVAQIIFDAKYTDGLTGLVNGTGFAEGLGLEIASSAKTGTDLTVITMDLKQFKIINDTLGHAVGDDALKVTAEILKKNARLTDLGVRISGDEFGLVLPQTNAEQAQVVMNRILTDLENQKALASADNFIHLVNINYSIKQWAQTDTINGFLKDLDLAMYEQKRGTSVTPIAQISQRAIQLAQNTASKIGGIPTAIATWAHDTVVNGPIGGALFGSPSLDFVSDQTRYNLAQLKLKYTDLIPLHPDYPGLTDLQRKVVQDVNDHGTSIYIAPGNVLPSNSLAHGPGSSGAIGIAGPPFFGNNKTFLITQGELNDVNDSLVTMEHELGHLEPTNQFSDPLILSQQTQNEVWAQQFAADALERLGVPNDNPAFDALSQRITRDSNFLTDLYSHPEKDPLLQSLKKGISLINIDGKLAPNLHRNILQVIFPNFSYPANSVIAKIFGEWSRVPIAYTNSGTLTLKPGDIVLTNDVLVIPDPSKTPDIGIYWQPLGKNYRPIPNTSPTPLDSSGITLDLTKDGGVSIGVLGPDGKLTEPTPDVWAKIFPVTPDPRGPTGANFDPNYGSVIFRANPEPGALANAWNGTKDFLIRAPTIPGRIATWTRVNVVRPLTNTRQLATGLASRAREVINSSGSTIRAAILGTLGLPPHMEVAFGPAAVRYFREVILPNLNLSRITGAPQALLVNTRNLLSAGVQGVRQTFSNLALSIDVNNRMAVLAGRRAVTTGTVLITTGVLIASTALNMILPMNPLRICLNSNLCTAALTQNVDPRIGFLFGGNFYLPSPGGVTGQSNFTPPINNNPNAPAAPAVNAPAPAANPPAAAPQVSNLVALNSNPAYGLTTPSKAAFYTGDKFAAYYEWSKNQTGSWWYKQTNGNFTKAHQLAVFIIAEATGGDVNLLKAIIEATKHQLWDAGNPYALATTGHDRYCYTADCQGGGGIFNFEGNYLEVARRRWESYVAKTPSPNSLKGFLNDSSQADAFAAQGYTLDRIARDLLENPQPIVWNLDVPSGWGNGQAWMDKATRVGNTGTTDDRGMYFAGGGTFVYTAGQRAYGNNEVPHDPTSSSPVTVPAPIENLTPTGSLPSTSNNSANTSPQQTINNGVQDIGVDHQITSIGSNPVKAHVVTVNNLDNIQFTFSPPTELVPTKDFLQATGSDFAINADGYGGLTHDNSNGLTYYKPEGPATIDGIQYKGLGQEASLYFDGNGKLILNKTPEGRLSLPRKKPGNAVTQISFPNLLINEGVLQDSSGFDTQLNSRTIFGIKNNGDVIIVSVQGSQTENGSGLTGASVEQMQKFMQEQEQGVDIAMNFDGGGSTSLAANVNGTPTSLNTPEGGIDAPVAVHLGMKIVKPQGFVPQNNAGNAVNVAYHPPTSIGNFSVYMQRNGSSAPINQAGDTLLFKGCGPTTAYNILKLLGGNPNLSAIVDSFYWAKGSATSADAVLLALQQNGFKGAVQYGLDNVITNLNQLKNYTGILVYGGMASSPTESVAHIAAFECKNGNCSSIDSYFSDGKPVACSIEGDNIVCGSYRYHIGPTGGVPDALYPVKTP